MFTVQIGSLLTCRDACVLEFALKADRESNGRYLGGTGGCVLGPNHVFVGACEPVKVSLSSLQETTPNPLLPDQTVLSPASTSTAIALMANPAAALPKWFPALSKCSFAKRDEMKADLETSMGIDGITIGTEIADGQANGDEVLGDGSKRKKIAKKAPKRHRSSVKLTKGSSKTQSKTKKRRGEESSDSPSDHSDSGDSWLAEDDSSVEAGIYDEGVGVGSDEDSNSEAGSVVEYSDGMGDD